jgi:hypothetical protein
MCDAPERLLAFGACTFLVLLLGCPRNKQKKNFGSNRNKPKLNLFRLIFGLFRETNKTFFRFASVFRIRFETTKTNISVSKQTEKKRKNTKETELNLYLIKWSAKNSLKRSALI